MCGISGVVYTKNDIIPSIDLLETMGRVMTHRGPDDRGL